MFNQPTGYATLANLDRHGLVIVDADGIASTFVGAHVRRARRPLALSSASGQHTAGPRLSRPAPRLR